MASFYNLALTSQWGCSPGEATLSLIRWLDSWQAQLLPSGPGCQLTGAKKIIVLPPTIPENGFKSMLQQCATTIDEYVLEPGDLCFHNEALSILSKQKTTHQCAFIFTYISIRVKLLREAKGQCSEIYFNCWEGINDVSIMRKRRDFLSLLLIVYERSNILCF